MGCQSDCASVLGWAGVGCPGNARENLLLEVSTNAACCTLHAVAYLPSVGLLGHFVLDALLPLHPRRKPSVPARGALVQHE